MLHYGDWLHIGLVEYIILALLSIKQLLLAYHLLILPPYIKQAIDGLALEHTLIYSVFYLSPTKFLSLILEVAINVRIVDTAFALSWILVGSVRLLLLVQGMWAITDKWSIVQ